MEKIYEYINIGEEGLWRQEHKADCGLLLNSNLWGRLRGHE